MKKFAFAAILGTLLHLGNVLCQTQASRIAFLCEEEMEVCTVNPDGSGRRKITRTPERSERWPTLSPDGKRIAFATFNPSQLYMVDSKGRNETLLRKSYWSRSRPAWSPGGTEIAFASFDRIYILDIITGEEKELWPTHDNGLPTADGYRDPAWSPDGRQIAFTISWHGKKRDIYVMNIDGDQLRQLTNHPAEDHAPAWSPDGRRIVFYSDRDKLPGIFVMDADGANLKRLTTGSHDYPAWSPEGTQIAVWMRGDPPGIGVMKAGGHGLKFVAEGSYPSWQRVGVAAAVKPMGKLPLIWGLLKSRLFLPQFYLSQ